jgi:hypothetical protein
MIGMAVVNDDQMVMWTNELFEDRQIKIIDRNILDWQPAIKELHLDPPRLGQNRNQHPRFTRSSI